MNNQTTFKLNEMMEAKHKNWQRTYYFELFDRLTHGILLSAEEAEWMAEYRDHYNYNPSSRPVVCFCCGKELSNFPTDITGCPACHRSFID